MRPAPRRLLNLSRLRRSDGQALVEFALVLPILLMVIYGIFDFGGAYNQANSLRFLANQAARYAEVNVCKPCGGSTPMIADYVPTTADTTDLQDNTSITYCLPSGSDGKAGSALRVTASKDYQWLPFMQSLGLPVSTPLSATVTVQLLAQSDGTLYPAPASLTAC